MYGIHCTDCKSFYIGKTKRHLEKRFKEHNDVRKPTAVTEHLINHNHSISFDKVDILTNGKCDNELLIKESLLVKRVRPDLNTNITSYPLEIF